MPDPEQIFHSYRKTKIAIYGLSPLTETLLTQLSGYQIVGLLDGYRTEGELYNQPILSFETAIQSGVRLIIVAARPESCKVIAKRIGDRCKECYIALLDIYGEDLCARKKAVYKFTGIQGISKEQLLHRIEEHEVVSVDLFDTLLMRRTLFPTDVYEIVGLRLEQRDIVIENFEQKRLEAEKELGKSTNPTLLEIYSYLLGKYPVPGGTAEDLAQLELETDRNLTVPRMELCQFLQEVRERGKEVYIVSDTFYTRSHLADLLENCGVTWYTDILSSCEYRTSKTQKLFEVLREKIPFKTCLHIGDSLDADVQGAERSGFTACQLYSGLHLFEKTGYLGLWEQLHSLSSRIQAGMFVAQLFNSPFQFEEAGRKIHVDQAHEIGYLFFAPVICGFVIWLYGRIKSCGLKNVWFSARDGYLIQKLYNQLGYKGTCIYFLTSRVAAIRAGIENEADIRYVEEMRFSGSLQEQLRERFGIAAEEDHGRDRLMDYKEEILEQAKIDRECYQAYLQSLPMAEGDIAFFDFVARGTVQMYVSRITERNLRGFYFLRQDEEYMHTSRLDIEGFYKKGEDSGIAGNYYILEAVLTSLEPSVRSFTKDGTALYGKETRSAEELACIQLVQDGIIDYFQVYRKLCPESEMLGNRELGELLLSLIHSIDIRDSGFQQLKVEDSFFNRMSNLSDLL